MDQSMQHHHIPSQITWFPYLLTCFDNELPPDLRSHFNKNQIPFQLTSPHNHIVNKAEREIQTFKSHFISGLHSTHSNFPLSLWPHLMEQAILTLNILRHSSRHPHLSAFHHLFGSYDYNKHPISHQVLRL